MRFFRILVALLVSACFASCGTPQPAAGVQQEESRALEQGEFRTDINGYEIFYVVRGQGPVCMVMPLSWGADHELLAGLLADLEGLMTMVYFDPRGMGKSAAIKADTDMSMAAVREDLEALRKHLGLDKVIVLGWSNGGQNVMRYASIVPEAVERLILLHTVAYVSPEDYEAMTAKYPELAARYDQFVHETSGAEGSDEVFDGKMREFFGEYYLPLLFADYPAHSDEYHRILEKTDLSLKHLLHNIQADPDANYDARPDLGRISAPTLVVAGRSDLLPPEVVEQISKGIKNSTFLVLENSGHFGPIEEPASFLASIKAFLEK